jgi:hypothetical protein
MRWRVNVICRLQERGKRLFTQGLGDKKQRLLRDY